MSQFVKILITIIALPTLVIYPFQSYIQKEWPISYSSFELYFTIFQVMLILGIIFILIDLWRNGMANYEVKLLWTFGLFFIVPSLTTVLYLWLYHEGSKGYVESDEELRV